MSGARFENADDARAYILAGHARITLVSQKTGARFTYKIRQPEGAPHFVSVLTGADNEADYTFLGTIFEPQGVSGSLVHVYRHGKRSTIGEDAPSAKAFGYVWRLLVHGRLPADGEVWHEGVCGKCGRALTVPESIARGIGPTCAEGA